MSRLLSLADRTRIHTYSLELLKNKCLKKQNLLLIVQFQSRQIKLSKGFCKAHYDYQKFAQFSNGNGPITNPIYQMSLISDLKVTLYADIVQNKTSQFGPRYMNSWLVGLFFFEQQPALQRKTSFSHHLDCQIQVKEREIAQARHHIFHVKIQ